MSAKTTKQRPSILKGEAKLELDEETKKVFGEFVKKAQKHKTDPRDFSQTIICGREEFAETEKHKKAKK